jgi:hypothetical protein
VDFHRRPLPESDPRRAGTPNSCVHAAHAGTEQGIASWKVAEQADRAGKRGKYTAKARAAAATRQRSEAGREPRHERPIGGQLHAVDVLVERHLNESIELRDKVPQPGKWSAKE